MTTDELQQIADRIEGILSESGCTNCDAMSVLGLVVAESLGGDPLKILQWIGTFARVAANYSLDAPVPTE